MFRIIINFMIVMPATDAFVNVNIMESTKLRKSIKSVESTVSQKSKMWFTSSF
jgi:aromatic ring-opening dioxygenase LigB subunit